MSSFSVPEDFLSVPKSSQSVPKSSQSVPKLRVPKVFQRVTKVKGESTKFLIINFKITSYGAKALLMLVQLAIKSIFEGNVWERQRVEKLV